MSGWKTNLMAQASRQYIEGVTNTPNSTFTIRLRFYGDGVFNTYTVNTDSNGYWRWYNTTGKQIYSLGGFVTNSGLPAGTAQSLLSVRFSDNFDWSRSVALDQAFGSSVDCAENLKSITNIATTNGLATCLQRAFQNCFTLEDLDLSKIKLQSTTTDLDLYYTFDSCRSLEEIKGFNELVRQKPISRLYWTFDECYKLKEIDFRGVTYIGTRGSNNFIGLFQDCWSLERIYNLNIIFGLQSSMSCIFRRCFSLISNETETIDLSTIDMSNMIISTNTNTGIYHLFYSSTTDMNNWEADNPGKRAFGNITHLGLPTYPEGMKNGNEWIRLRNLTTIVGCGDIHTPALDSNNSATITFSNSPLTLDSAKLIMQHIKQATAGSTSNFIFSTYTRNLISNDSAAMALVAQCQSLGWTMYGF